MKILIKDWKMRIEKVNSYKYLESTVTEYTTWSKQYYREGSFLQKKANVVQA